MIFIPKQQEAPQAFIEAITTLNNDYNALEGENRRTVLNLLSAEQGWLCPLCERNLSKLRNTIEHFFPQSVFPDLQLSYHNLYAACADCNTPKGSHLMPGYIFDKRFDPCDIRNLFDEREGLKPRYSLNDSKCFLIVPAAIKPPKKIQPIHHSSYILSATFDLIDQNRTTLLYQRASIYNSFLTILPTLTDQKIIVRWRTIMQTRNISKYQYNEFISLEVLLLEQAMKKRGITFADL